MNLIVLKGRLIADPEVKKVGANQTTVCEFCIAVDRKFEKDKTDFINCVAWGNTGEFIGKYFVKGKEISFRGELNIDQYEKDGEKRYSTKVKVTGDVEFCGSKNDSDNNSEKPNNSPAAPADFEEIDDDEDLPFA